MTSTTSTSTSINSALIIDDDIAIQYGWHPPSWPTGDSSVSSSSSPHAPTSQQQWAIPLQIIASSLEQEQRTNSTTNATIGNPLSSGMRWYTSWMCHIQFRVIGIKPSHSIPIVNRLFHDISLLPLIPSGHSDTNDSATSVPTVLNSGNANNNSHRSLTSSILQLNNNGIGIVASIFHGMIMRICHQFGYSSTSLSIVESSFPISSSPSTPVTSSSLPSHPRHHTSSHSSRAVQLDDDHWRLARNISEGRRCFIIMLAGTSGTGKSTLASLLGDRLRVSTVISTDSIRHMLRHSTDKNIHPALFMSTYQAAETVMIPNISHTKKVRLGYKTQSNLVTQQMDHMIDYWSNNQVGHQRANEE